MEIPFQNRLILDFWTSIRLQGLIFPSLLVSLAFLFPPCIIIITCNTYHTPYGVCGLKSAKAQQAGWLFRHTPYGVCGLKKINNLVTDSYLVDVTLRKGCVGWNNNQEDRVLAPCFLLFLLDTLITFNTPPILLKGWGYLSPACFLMDFSVPMGRFEIIIKKTGF